MSFEFRPAVRENVGLLIGLAGSTGSGKTFSAMRLASGIAGGKRFAVIDTEAGRAKHYADQFQFDHGDLQPPFSPMAYADAIRAADAAGYPVIVVDSASHEHAGEGGLLDWHETELQRMAGDDWRKRENCNMAAWIKPKTAHKAMVSRLLQVRAHLILCFRAEEKIEMVRGDDGKMKIVPKVTRTGLDGWVPICEKNLPFEMTVSFLLTSDAPGIPKPIKLQEQHRSLFPAGQPINEDAGRRLAAWAAGSTPVTLLNQAEQVADKGFEALRGWYATLSDEQTVELKEHKPRLVAAAKASDARMATETAAIIAEAEGEPAQDEAALEAKANGEEPDEVAEVLEGNLAALVSFDNLDALRARKAELVEYLKAHDRFEDLGGRLNAAVLEREKQIGSFRTAKRK